MEVWRMAEVRTAISDEIDSYLDALVQKGVFANKAGLGRSALVRAATGPEPVVPRPEAGRGGSKRGMTAAGIVWEDGVLLAAEVVTKTKLTPGYRKLQVLSDKLALVPSGLAADGWLVIWPPSGSLAP